VSIPTPNAKCAFENFEFYLQQQTLLNAPNPPYRIVSDKCLKHFVTYYFLDDEDEDEDERMMRRRMMMRMKRTTLFNRIELALESFLDLCFGTGPKHVQRSHIVAIWKP
jgi:hypothetical protein